MKVFHTAQFRWLALFGLVVAGCSSFNSYTYLPRDQRGRVDPIEQKYHDEKAEEIEEKAVQIAAKDLCPRMKLTKLPATPEVPVKELETMDPYNKDALIEFQSRYIKRLHAYTLQVKRTVEKDRREYERQCQQSARERISQQVSPSPEE